MSTNESVNKVAEQLKALAREIRSDNASLGGQIELVAAEVSGLAQGRPDPKTSDFDIAGDEVALPGSDEENILERIIDENDLLPVFFLEKGAEMQRAVGRVVLLEPVSGLPAGSGWGTGSLISPSLFMTNNHVIDNLDFAEKVRMQFNYQLGSQGIEQPSESYFPESTGTFHTNAALDYTVIRLKKAVPAPQAGSTPIAPGDRWGWIPLNPSPGYHAGQHFNIVQHPQGRRKEVALQDNEIASLFTNVVRYHGDTEPGSSGSPVFNNVWQIIALHHAGGDRDPQTGKWLNNEGIRIDRIVEDLRGAFQNDPAVLEELGI